MSESVVTDENWIHKRILVIKNRAMTKDILNNMYPTCTSCTS